MRPLYGRVGRPVHGPALDGEPGSRPEGRGDLGQQWIALFDARTAGKYEMRSEAALAHLNRRHIRRDRRHEHGYAQQAMPEIGQRLCVGKKSHS